MRADSKPWVLVTDVHAANHRICGGPRVAGINTRGQQIVDALKRASDFTEEVGGRLAILGDLLDDERPPPQLLRKVADALSVETHIILGNHERVSEAMGDNSLSVLGIKPNIRVYEEPAVVDGFLLVPFNDRPASEWLPALLFDFADKDIHAVGIHVGIYDEIDMRDKPWDVTKSADAMSSDLLAASMVAAGIKYAFCGNWHEFQVWDTQGVTITQIGALTPTGWDNPGHDKYGGVSVYHPRVSVENLKIPGPRFIQVVTIAEFQAEILRARDSEDYIYLRCAVSPVEASEIKQVPLPDNVSLDVSVKSAHCSSSIPTGFSQKTELSAVLSDAVKALKANRMTKQQVRERLKLRLKVT